MYSMSEFETCIQDVIDRFVLNNRLSVDNVVFKENKENKKGDPVKSLQFIEFEYPFDPNKAIQSSVLKPILRVEFKTNYINLMIPFRLFDVLPTPTNSGIKMDDKSNFATIRIDTLSVEIFDYIEQAMINSYANYSSSQDSFACCSSYEYCSDQMYCVHENLLYAKKCIYRRNLEAGKIFYGKNCNVSQE